MRIADCRVRIAVGLIVALVSAASGQESPTATASTTPPPASSPSASPARSVRISFVPPPLDGTISLGIYDTGGKLVRVLHQEASVDVFTIGADALQTRWDGKDDDGFDLPAGKYHARGYAVGNIKSETISETASSPPAVTSDKVVVKLMSNPLVKGDRQTVELSIGFDDTDSFLKTADDLPLRVLSERPDVTSVIFARNGDKSIDMWQNSSAGTEHFRVSNVDQMMAFDCGAFDLK